MAVKVKLSGSAVVVNLLAGKATAVAILSGTASN